MADDPETLACPVCGRPSRPYCTRPGHGRTWPYRRCPACGHGYVSVRPTPALLEEFYRHDEHQYLSAHPLEGAEGAHDCRAIVKAVCSLTGERGASLDVGSGCGHMSYHLAKQGFRPVMLDLDLRAQLAAVALPGAFFHLGSFEEFSYPRPFSAIVMSQVLEHALDPLAWLRRAHTLLSPTGILAIALPNFAGIYRLLGSGDPFLVPPIHLNHFTAGSLRRALTQTGFEVLRVRSSSQVWLAPWTRGFDMRRTAGWLWNGASRALDPTPCGIILRVYARLAAPRSRKSNPRGPA